MTDAINPPCRVCGVEHQWDKTNGWRAKNGHPMHAYDRRPREWVEGVPVMLGEPHPPGFTPWFGGIFFECARCRCLVVGKDDGLEAHLAEHARLDDELAALWRALEARRAS